MHAVLSRPESRKVCLSFLMDDLNQDYGVERGVGGKRPFSDDEYSGGPAVKRINVNIGRCEHFYFCQRENKRIGSRDGVLPLFPGCSLVSGEGYMEAEK